LGSQQNHPKLCSGRAWYFLGIQPCRTDSTKLPNGRNQWYNEGILCKFSVGNPRSSPHPLQPRISGSTTNGRHCMAHIRIEGRT
jgi:hypothetical protein